MLAAFIAAMRSRVVRRVSVLVGILTMDDVSDVLAVQLLTLDCVFGCECRQELSARP
jgi:hypothetical protein